MPFFFGIGTLLAGLADPDREPGPHVSGFGVVAGLGNGFGYVTPIATLIRWFPDKRGLVTGLAVMGFGLGAFFMGKIVPGMILAMGVTTTFYVWASSFWSCVRPRPSFQGSPRGGFRPGSSLRPPQPRRPTPLPLGRPRRPVSGML